MHSATIGRRGGTDRIDARNSKGYLENVMRKKSLHSYTRRSMAQVLVPGTVAQGIATLATNRIDDDDDDGAAIMRCTDGRGRSLCV